MNIKINHPRRKTFTQRWKTNKRKGGINSTQKNKNSHKSTRQKEIWGNRKDNNPDTKIIHRNTKDKDRPTKEANIRNYKMHEEAKTESKRWFHRSMQTWARRTKKVTLNKYIKSQKHYRDAIEEEEKKKTNEKKNNQPNKKDPNTIWQARKRARTNNEKEYNIITEDGWEITDPQETKEHIASYFEDLYQARPGTPECEESTRHITETMKKLKLEYKRENNKKPITEKKWNTQ